MYTETMRAYKLFRTLKTRPGEIFPLFIDKTRSIPMYRWLTSECVPTKGFMVRSGWHCINMPYAPHLLKKDGTTAQNRVWGEVDIPISNYYTMRKSKDETEWIIAEAIRVVKLLRLSDIEKILHWEIKSRGIRLDNRSTDSTNRLWI